MNSDTQLLIATAGFFIAVFGAFQLEGWHARRAIVGGNLRFAQFMIVGGLTATALLALLHLTITFELQVLKGWPFVLLYVGSILSLFFLPAMFAIEVILLVELFLARQASRTIRLWHIGALAACAGWVAFVLGAALLGPK